MGLNAANFRFNSANVRFNLANSRLRLANSRSCACPQLATIAYNCRALRKQKGKEYRGDKKEKGRVKTGQSCAGPQAMAKQTFQSTSRISLPKVQLGPPFLFGRALVMDQPGFLIRNPGSSSAEAMQRKICYLRGKSE